MSTYELPSEEVLRLDALRTPSTLPELRARIRALREHGGWTLDEIAHPMHTHRSTVRAWEIHPDHEAPPADVPIRPGRMQSIPTLSPGLGRRPGARMMAVGTLPAMLTTDERVTLERLSSSARRVRGHTAAHASSRQAAAELDELLISHRARGVMVSDLAAAVKLTDRAVRARISESPDTRTQLRGIANPSVPVLIVWEAPSRKYSTFVTRRNRMPVAFNPGDFIEPAETDVPYYLLTPAEADRQLGWPIYNTFLFPGAVT